jgi:hypothetical protein
MPTCLLPFLVSHVDIQLWRSSGFDPGRTDSSSPCGYGQEGSRRIPRAFYGPRSLEGFIQKSPGKLYSRNLLLYAILRFIQTKSITFYTRARKRNSNLTVRIHPLLLSLTETLNASETNPDISAISENDERVLRSNFYTPPSAFPPLEIHFSGQNGSSPLHSKWLHSHFGSWLPRMHGIPPSGQLGVRGGGRCHSRQFGSNIPCPVRQFRAHMERISEPA